ncbi:hypothetical protein D3877_23520 [Azospirillum cavernae]|uniref:Uncharacterized protein n=2 Tax=Azospirillum cavernae TaxID=2320860 RepID=A0A418VPB3_9PROT|nr:hypothetical protein D3877_23520 [Azospirillum cavernae]
MRPQIQKLDRHPMFGFLVQAAKDRAGGWIEDRAAFDALVLAEYAALRQMLPEAKAPDGPERDSLDSLTAEWSSRMARPAAWRPSLPERVFPDFPDAPPMRDEDIPDDGLGAFRDMLDFPDPVVPQRVHHILADTDHRVQVAAQAQADKRAARKPGKAKQVFEPPVPKGMGPKKRWALS